jgi:hypothetical protein
MKTCQTCKHSGKSRIYAIACYRPKKFKSGRTLYAQPNIGFSTDFETGHPDIYEGRSCGDNCSFERVHWSAKE